MSKITPSEFENYGQKFHELSIRAMVDTEIAEESEEEKIKARKFFSLIVVEVKGGSVFALAAGCDFFEKLLKKDLSAIKKRVKEHIIARGNYNPASPLSLTEWRERKEEKGWKNFRKSIRKNNDYFHSLLMEMNEEDFQFIWNTFCFWESAEEIFPSGPEEESQKMTEEDWKEMGFIHEDILKTLEKAWTKLEAKKKKKKKKKNGSPNSPSSLNSEQWQKIIDRLIKDKENLQNQKNYLENQQSQNESEQNLKEKLIAQINEQLKDKEAEIEKIKKQKQSNQPTGSNPNNNSTLAKWAIGLSIMAIVIVVVALLIWLKPRKKS